MKALHFTFSATSVVLVVTLALLLTACRAVQAYRRIKVLRAEGRHWPDVLADGPKPMTGHVWLDAAIYTALSLLPFAAMAWVFL